MKRKMPYQQPQMLVVKISCQYMLSKSRLDVRNPQKDYWEDPSEAD